MSFYLRVLGARRRRLLSEIRCREGLLIVPPASERLVQGDEIRQDSSLTLGLLILGGKQ